MPREVAEWQLIQPGFYAQRNGRRFILKVDEDTEPWVSRSEPGWYVWEVTAFSWQARSGFKGRPGYCGHSSSQISGPHETLVEAKRYAAPS